MQLLAGSCWSNEHDLIFTNGLGGVLSYQTVYDCFKQIVEKIGTASSRFHDLRHHYTVVALQSGDDMKTMRKIWDTMPPHLPFGTQKSLETVKISRD